MKIWQKVLFIFLSFALFSSALVFVGKPDSPAIIALNKIDHRLDIAIIGDSRAHTGFSPTEISRVLAAGGIPGVSGYNFGVDGTDVLHHFSFVSNHLLKSAALPKILIWTPNPLQFDEKRSNNRLEQLSLADLKPLWSAGFSFEMLLDVFTMSIFKPWRHRPLVALVISDYAERAGLRTLPIQTRLLGLSFEKEPLSREYVTLPDGQVPFKVLTWDDRFKRGAESYIKEYDRLSLGKAHFQLARELARQVRLYGSKLVIIETPLAPWFRDHLANRKVHQEWRNQMAEIAKEESAAYWDHSSIYNDDHQFGDPGHMPLETAQAYSGYVAKALLTDLELSGLLGIRVGAK